MRIDFQNGWIYSKIGEEKCCPIMLPHDAMLAEKRTDMSAGGKGAAWFEGADYRYEKRFDKPQEGKVYLLEFEGVYRNAEVWLNGRQLAFHPNGYTGFTVDITEGLLEKNNELVVLARNADMPNSRWYSGAGIYRPVWLHCLPEHYILPYGIRIETVDYKKKIVRVQVETVGTGEISAEICGLKKTKWTEGNVSFVFELPYAQLWSAEAPNLYACNVTFGDEKRTVMFGVRCVEWGAKIGLTINGERVILRGACVHHDNGILGACCYAEAEERKVRILKENGYNAVRSAHNPCSKVFLDACDRIGMYVLDELTDVWYLHKNPFDYATYFEKNWQEDIRAMVGKDYSHPSVIMYSVGNENTETAFEKGISLTGQMTEFLHSLDNTRPVTCGINPMLNWLSKFTGEKGNDSLKQKQSAKKGAKGSEFFNRLTGLLSSRGTLFAAKMRVCGRRTENAFAKLDIAGYNYGISRYNKDLKRYPQRLILGTETFCRDAAWFWNLAKKEPRIIGDFVWAGIDYLGEVGIGAWEYEDYAPDFSGGAGWIAAGSGRIDLTGKPTAEAAYTQVVFGLNCNPVIAVVPVNRTKERHTVSAWRMSNAICSWSWDGCEGMPASVEVYSNAHSVALFVNGKKAGKRKVGDNCIVRFRCNYRHGSVEAVAYDKTGRVTGRASLHTAEKETLLRIIPEKKSFIRGEVGFFRIQLTDRNGNVKPLSRAKIEVHISGGDLLGLGNACPYNAVGFLHPYTETYYGEALAAVRAREKGELIVSCTCRYGKDSASVEVI